MTSFDLEDDPFRRIREEMDQLQVYYSKLEFVTKGASKLLGNCKPFNITKDLKKLKQKYGRQHNPTFTCGVTQGGAGNEGREDPPTEGAKDGILEQIWEIVGLRAIS